MCLHLGTHFLWQLVPGMWPSLPGPLWGPIWLVGCAALTALQSRDKLFLAGRSSLASGTWPGGALLDLPAHGQPDMDVPQFGGRRRLPPTSIRSSVGQLGGHPSLPLSRLRRTGDQPSCGGRTRPSWLNTTQAVLVRPSSGGGLALYLFPVGKDRSWRRQRHSGFNSAVGPLNASTWRTSPWRSYIPALGGHRSTALDFSAFLDPATLAVVTVGSSGPSGFWHRGHLSVWRPLPLSTSAGRWRTWTYTASGGRRITASGLLWHLGLPGVAWHGGQAMVTTSAASRRLLSGVQRSPALLDTLADVASA